MAHRDALLLSEMQFATPASAQEAAARRGLTPFHPKVDRFVLEEHAVNLTMVPGTGNVVLLLSEMQFARETSLTKNSHLLGPYSRTMPMALWWP